MADQTQVLHILALGPPEVRLGEHLVSFPTRKTLALLVYLSVEGGIQPREHLAATLWPESNPVRSYANLRNTLGHLQKLLVQVDEQPQNAYLSITHKVLGLNPAANINFDLRTVNRAYALAREERSSRSRPGNSVSLPLLQAAAACQRGDFLTGFSLGDAPGFDDWAAIQREVWNRRLGLILDRLSEIQFARGDFSGVTETISQWIALDALNEVAYRRKMRAHFSSGERGQALDTYEACRVILAAELDVKPEPETVELSERIRTQASPAHAQPHRSPSSEPHLPNTPVAFLGNLFTGRVKEHQLLVRSFENASAGQPQLVMLRGEAGIGKTCLARKFLTWASAQGAELLQGGAFESGSHLPFQPLVEALRLRLAYKNSLQDLLDDVRLSPLTQLLPELRQRYPIASPHPLGIASPESDISQAQFYEPLMQYTLALSKSGPLVFFMDDLQWADSATLDLLQYAIRHWRDRSARILLIVSLRSEALHSMPRDQHYGSSLDLVQWLERLTRELTPVHIELKPLNEPETVQMVQAILSPPADDFAHWLYNETRGQPFYLMETLKDLLERRVLNPKRNMEGGWTFALDAEHDLGKSARVPSTVHRVIRARLNRLSPNAFSLLAAGAVLEQQITFERMCIISNVTKDLALPALDELISGRLLVEALHPGGASAYAFANDMLRDVVYTEAGDARRRLFHQRALESLVEADESAAVLAHHAQAAGQVQTVFRYSLDAGFDALNISAVKDAIVHLERARQFVISGEIPDPEAKADLRKLYLVLSEAYKLVGQTENALAIDAEWDSLG